ncbi:MAG: GNAT family N-acetyltransferase [Parcubacteria group bacterium]
MKLKIGYAAGNDLDYLQKNDNHIDQQKVKEKVDRRQVIIVKDDQTPIGWLRFGYLYDIIPFMNMLTMEDKYQKQGIGSKLVKFWEEEMKKAGHKMVLTSSQANEDAQHFYRKIGYEDAGALFGINDEPESVGVPAELFFLKRLK